MRRCDVAAVWSVWRQVSADLPSEDAALAWVENNSGQPVHDALAAGGYRIMADVDRERRASVQVSIVGAGVNWRGEKRGE